ncbi:MAG: hypothetical protein HY877_09400 [Deltaproteobacteria bacterium]|nr:hypothetical protein [Deltaproteobacteria bacterium]
MNTSKKENFLANLLILVSVFGRLIPHPANVTPMGGVSLVGGAKLSRFWKWSIPFIALVMSDFLLGVFRQITPWSYVTPFIYLSFAINIFLGSRIGTEHRYRNLTLFSILGSAQFFILSNFGVWMEGFLYPKTLSGLMECYTLAIPFLRNSLLGDLCWSLALFTVLSRVQSWVHTKEKIQTVSL